jgi:rod shape-determining protein MreC
VRSAEARRISRRGCCRLERDNQRLRGLLGLQQGASALVAAPVISRETGGWWQQLELRPGQRMPACGVGDGVLAPGGLIGRVASVTPSTARVALLTDQRQPPGGVGAAAATPWPAGRARAHRGRGCSFIDRTRACARRPDHHLPRQHPAAPNLTVGVMQSVNEQLVPAP